MLYFYEDMTIDDIKYPSYYPYIEHIIRGKVLKIPTENILADRTELKIGNALLYCGQPYLIDDISESGNYVVESADGDVRVLTDIRVEKMDSLLDEFRINYLKYNNLYYYYVNMYEKINQPSLFITQFCCSKVSRAMYDWGRGMISATHSQRLYIVQSVISRLISCMEYTSGIKYQIDDDWDNRKSNITTTLTMKGLVNKVYTVNFMLNLT
jgi:hypothetical protein